MRKSDLASIINLICKQTKNVSFKQDSFNTTIVNKTNLLYIFTHIRLSTFFYKTGFVLMTGCDLCNNTVLCIYTLNLAQCYKYNLATVVTKNLDTVKNLYLNAGWYEREFSEFFGVTILGSDDTRGLLLVYNNTAHPLKKTQTTVAAGAVNQNKKVTALTWYTL